MTTLSWAGNGRDKATQKLVRNSRHPPVKSTHLNFPRVLGYAIRGLRSAQGPVWKDACLYSAGVGGTVCNGLRMSPTILIVFGFSIVVPTR